jgi:hypothetical protein
MGLDPELFRKVNAAATRSICAAFQGGVDAPPETRKLALGLATGRFLHHILDGECDIDQRFFSMSHWHFLTLPSCGCSLVAVMEWDAGAAGAGTASPPWALIDNHPLPPVGSACPKMLLYSGHDWTLMPLLMALNPRYGVSSGEDANSVWVDFAADLAFEAYVEGLGAEREVWCRVLYRGQVMGLPVSGGRADGVCSVKALRGWLETQGLLMGDVKRWNEMCNAR